MQIFVQYLFIWNHFAFLKHTANFFYGQKSTIYTKTVNICPFYNRIILNKILSFFYLHKDNITIVLRGK
jgi:hypothetical protein